MSDTDTTTTPMQTDPAITSASNPLQGSPDISNLPISTRPTSQVTPTIDPVKEHHSVLGAAVQHFAHALEGKEITGYERDPDSGELKAVIQPRKPGGLFRDILLGALAGSTVGAGGERDSSGRVISGGGGPVAGFARGLNAGMNVTETRNANTKQDFLNKEADQSRKTQSDLVAAQAAVHTMNVLQFGHFAHFHNPDEISRHDTSSQVVQNQLLKNGASKAQVIVGGQDINGKPGNGPEMMKMYNQDPESVMYGGPDFHRVPLITYSTDGLEFSPGKGYIEKDGTLADLNQHATVTLVDIPISAWNKNIRIPRSTVNDAAGSQLARGGKSSDPMVTTIGGLFALGSKNIDDLNKERQELMRGPKDENEALQRMSEVERINNDPNATDEEKHRAAIQGPTAQAWLNKQAQQKTADQKPGDVEKMRGLEVALANGNISTPDRQILAAYQRGQKLSGVPAEIQAQVGKPPVPADYPKGDADPQYRKDSATWGQKVQQRISQAAGQKKTAELNAEANSGQGENGPTGDAYLNTLSAAQKNNLQAYRDGRLEITSAFARSKTGMQILTQLTQAYPDFDASKAPAYFKMRQDFTSGKTADGITALNTAISHLERAADHTSALATVPGLRNLARLTGNENATGLNSDKEAVSMELGKAYKNGVVTNDEAKSWKALLDASTPAELKGNIRELAELLTGRLQALRDRWDNGKPSANVSPVRIASPSTLRIYKKITGEDLSGFSDSPSSQNEQVSPQPQATPHPFFSKFGGKAD